MPKRLSRSPRRSADPNVSAFRLVQQIEARSEGPKKPAKVVPMRARKNPAAVALGRKGGIRSAVARMDKIAPEERRRIAREAARARWARRKDHG